MAACNVVGYGPAGIFHELDAGSSAGNRQAIGLCHLGGGEQFHHACRRPHDIFSCTMKA
jgi:hypothetical protein